MPQGPDAALLPWTHDLRSTTFYGSCKRIDAVSHRHDATATRTTARSPRVPCSLAYHYLSASGPVISCRTTPVRVPVPCHVPPANCTGDRDGVNENLLTPGTGTFRNVTALRNHCCILLTATSLAHANRFDAHDGKHHALRQTIAQSAKRQSEKNSQSL